MARLRYRTRRVGSVVLGFTAYIFKRDIQVQTHFRDGRYLDYCPELGLHGRPYSRRSWAKGSFIRAFVRAWRAGDRKVRAIVDMVKELKL